MTITFSDQVDIFPSEASWYFVRVPEDHWDNLRLLAKDKARGFGSIKVDVTLGNIQWSTSLFPDTKSRRYILFIKKSVRSQAKIDIGDIVTITCNIQ